MGRGACLLRKVEAQKAIGQPNWLWIFGLCWVAVILAAGILPVNNFVGHSHWNAIVWYPSSDWLYEPRILLRILVDVVENILLFGPLGWIWAQYLSLKGQRSRVLVVAIGFLLSLSIELYQIYCHNRVPSFLDLLANTCGTYWGARLGSDDRYKTGRLLYRFCSLADPITSHKRHRT